MNNQGFETWLCKGLPKGYFKGRALIDLKSMLLPVDYTDEGEVIPNSSLESTTEPEKVIGQSLYECNLNRRIVEGWKQSGMLDAIGLQLASLGVSTQHELRYLWFRSHITGVHSYNSYPIMDLVAGVNLNNVLVEHSAFDISGLLDRFKIAIESGAFHAFWSKGLVDNPFFPIERGRMQELREVRSYVSAVIFAHYSGALLPPDLDEKVTAKSVQTLISFEQGDAWRSAFSDLRNEADKYDFTQSRIFGQIMSQAVPLAKHAGICPRFVAQRCSDIMDAYSEKPGARVVTPIEQAYKRLMLMNILWDCPEMWVEFELTTGDLLGWDYRVIGNEDHRELWVNSLWHDSLIPRNHTGSNLGDRMLLSLSKRYPDLYSPLHIARKWGTCTAKWFNGVKDFEPARAIINDMMSKGEWHYGFERKRLNHLFGEDAGLAAVMTFLDKGGNANLERAVALISQYPSIGDKAFVAVTKVSQIKRLASLIAISPVQMQKLSSKMRDAVLAVNLGL